MALENMSAAFSGLPMGDLIGGPLNAACDAQVRLAMATVNFIKVVGFEPPKDPAKGAWGGDTRTAKFKFKRPNQVTPAIPATYGPNPDRTKADEEVDKKREAYETAPDAQKKTDLEAAIEAANKIAPTVLVAPGKPAVIDIEDVEIEVPVLAIVKVPSLSINSVDVTFDMEVKSSESSKETDAKSGSLEASVTAGWGPVKGSVTIKGSVSTTKENTRSSDNSAKYHVEVHARDDGMPEGLSRVLDMLHQAIAPKAINAPSPTTP